MLPMCGMLECGLCRDSWRCWTAVVTQEWFCSVFISENQRFHFEIREILDDNSFAFWNSRNWSQKKWPLGFCSELLRAYEAFCGTNRRRRF